MSARVHLYSEVLNFWGKDEIENYKGLYWDFFFSVFTVFIECFFAACTFSLILKCRPLPSKNRGCALEWVQSKSNTLYLHIFRYTKKLFEDQRAKTKKSKICIG